MRQQACMIFHFGNLIGMSQGYKSFINKGKEKSNRSKLPSELKVKILG